MPLAAAIAPLLQGPSGQLYGLYIDNLNVGPFTLKSSIEIIEAAPGGVSSMSFVVEDPTGVIPLPAAGAIVRHQDFTFDEPDFLGYVDDYTVTVMGIGRTIAVRAVGVEIVLDWIVIPSTVLIAGINGDPISAINHGVLATSIRYLAATVGEASDNRLDLITAGTVVSTPNGSADSPVGTVDNPELDDPGPVGPGSLRAAMESTIKLSYYGSFFSPTGVPDAVITVDFRRRLRMFFRAAAPDDYTNLEVANTLGGTLQAENLRYEVHPSDVVRSVYIVGGDADGSGFVSDGSGIFGRMEVLTVPDSTSVGRRDQVAAMYLASQAALVRGTFELTDWTPTEATIHPGSSVTITDFQVGLLDVYAISEITKSFTGKRQNWTVAFGGIRPSFVETVRRDYSTDATFATLKLSGVRSN